MTFIGFLLGLAVGAGLMFYLAGSRAQQQGTQGQQGGQAQQGRRQGQQAGGQGMAARPRFNTEFGAMDDASTNQNNSVKPAALSAAVFAREGSGAHLTEQGNQQASGQAPTDAAVLESGVGNQQRTSATTITAYNNDTNPDPSLAVAAISVPTDKGNDSQPVNIVTSGAGTSKTKQKRK